jgi:hypothetical protein
VGGGAIYRGALWQFIDKALSAAIDPLVVIIKDMECAGVHVFQRQPQGVIPVAFKVLAFIDNDRVIPAYSSNPVFGVPRGRFVALGPVRCV